jgi:hypothetical protein
MMDGNRHGGHKFVTGGIEETAEGSSLTKCMADWLDRDVVEIRNQKPA